MGRLRQAPSAVDLGDGLTPRDVPMDTLSSYVTAFGAKPTGEGPCHVPEVNPMGQYRTNRSQTEWTLAHGDDEGVAHTTSGSMPLHAFHTGERAAVARPHGLSAYSNRSRPSPPCSPLLQANLPSAPDPRSLSSQQKPSDESHHI